MQTEKSSDRLLVIHGDDRDSKAIRINLDFLRKALSEYEFCECHANMWRVRLEYHIHPYILGFYHMSGLVEEDGLLSRDVLEEIYR